jgi:hypothetical protein
METCPYLSVKMIILRRSPASKLRNGIQLHVEMIFIRIVRLLLEFSLLNKCPEMAHLKAVIFASKE